MNRLSDWRLWLGLTLVLRLLLSYYLWSEWSFLLKPGELALSAGDTETYLAPPENWLRSGVWGASPDGLPTLKPSAGRMPGYGLTYLFFRLFADPAAARALLLLLQWSLSVAAAFVLARWVAEVSGRAWLFGPLLLALGTACWFVQYDLRLLTESLSVSLLVLAAVGLLRARRTLDLLLPGLLLAAAVFLRPLMGIFWAFGGLWALWLFRGAGRRWLVAGLLFALPLLVFEAGWIVRNRVSLGLWAPLQSSVYADYEYTPVRLALFDFVRGWGGDIVWWNPEAEIRVFLPDSAGGLVSAAANTLEALPQPLFAALGEAELRQLAADCRLAEAARSPALQARAAAAVRRADERYRSADPFDHQATARLRLLRRYFIRSGTEDLLGRPFSALPLTEKLLKLYFSGLYAAMVGLGFLGLALWAWRRREEAVWLLLALVAYALAVPWGFRFCEWRYQLPLYPFLIAGAVFLAGEGLAALLASVRRSKRP